jgi:hypothetical protein
MGLCEYNISDNNLIHFSSFGTEQRVRNEMLNQKDIIEHTLKSSGTTEEEVKKCLDSYDKYTEKVIKKLFDNGKLKWKYQINVYQGDDPNKKNLLQKGREFIRNLTSHRSTKHRSTKVAHSSSGGGKKKTRKHKKTLKKYKNKK